ncbi:MAG TPA: hypothetical protein VFV08_07685 [Puia sp.]|nr:hypothetical protein [Puia sp.]
MYEYAKLKRSRVELLQVVAKNYPRDSVTQETMRALRALDKTIEANMLLIKATLKDQFSQEVK